MLILVSKLFVLPREFDAGLKPSLYIYAIAVQVFAPRRPRSAINRLTARWPQNRACARHRREYRPQASSRAPDRSLPQWRPSVRSTATSAPPSPEFWPAWLRLNVRA